MQGYQPAGKFRLSSAAMRQIRAQVQLLVARTAYESRSARELQGLPLEPETQPLEALPGLLTYHPDDAPLRESAMLAHLDAKTPYCEVGYRVRCADGQYRWIHVRAVHARGRRHAAAHHAW